MKLPPIKPSSVILLLSAILLSSSIMLAPSVRAQSGPPDSSPPAVQVEVTDPLPLPVTVGNLPPAHEPVNIAEYHVCSTNGFGCVFTDVYTVPAGKRLVIEYVSMIIGDVEAPETVAPRIVTSAGGTTSWHDLGASAEISNVGGFPNIVIAKNVKLYADPGTTLIADFRRDRGISQYGYSFTVNISGYLEAVP